MDTDVCRECGREKDSSKFVRPGWCRECHNEYHRKWKKETEAGRACTLRRNAKMYAKGKLPDWMYS